MKVVFVRHGESTGNAGAAAADHTAMTLSPDGLRQAEAIAEQWRASPDLIVVSTYLRTQLTAQPTARRFSNVPVEVLPMEEFTYLDPSRWNGTLRTERLPHIEAFWQKADPAYQDGPGAESFELLLARVDRTLKLLQALPAQSLVYAFGHGQFMQAVRVALLFPHWSAKQKMKNFWAFNARHPIGNADQMEADFNGGRWSTPNVERQHRPNDGMPD